MLSAASAAAAAAPMGIGVAEDRLLGEEPLVLALVGEPRAVDLVELEAEEVALAVAGAASPPSSSSVALRLAKRRPSRFELAQVDAGEAIQRPSLARGGEQAHVGVLGVEVDEAGGQLGELRGGDQATVAVGAGSAGARHDPGEDELVVVDDEPALDGGLVGAGADDRRRRLGRRPAARWRRPASSCRPRSRR